LGSKIEELQTQNNILAIGGVIALFLDDELRVRWVTQAINALFP
jgi:hypothetical protein